MKITKERLKQIVKEEIQSVMQEILGYDDGSGHEEGGEHGDYEDGDMLDDDEDILEELDSE